MEQLTGVVEHNGELAKLFDLEAGHPINKREVVSGIGESNRGFRAFLC